MTRDGVAERPWLGIVGLSLNAETSRYYDLPLEHGVLVTKVSDGSPAQSAGLVMGDIILQIDGVRIESIEDLLGQIHGRKIGEEVRITVFRRGFQQDFSITLSAMP
jgi:serine protease Do